MHDRPTSTELVTAVRQFLETELLPTLDDPRLRYQTRVAVHALGLVERELPREEADLRADHATFAQLLGTAEPTPNGMTELRTAVQDSNRQLCVRIRKGEFDQPAAFAALVRQLRPLIERKLEVSQNQTLSS